LTDGLRISEIPSKSPEELLEKKGEESSVEERILQYLKWKLKEKAFPKIKIKEMANELKLDKGDLTKKLKELQYRLVEKEKIWLVKGVFFIYTFTNQIEHAHIILDKGGDLSVGVFGVNVGAKWAHEKFSIKCGICKKVDSTTPAPNFKDTHLVFCKNCKATLMVHNLKEFFE
jgi:hypothetical protein